MEDVVVSDAVATGRPVDLHTRIMYYEIVTMSASGDEGDDKGCRG